MGEKVIRCCVCEKDISAEVKADGFMQIRYRVMDSGETWESEWKTLCKKCSELFPLWSLTSPMLLTDIHEYG